MLTSAFTYLALYGRGPRNSAFYSGRVKPFYDDEDDDEDDDADDVAKRRRYRASSTGSVVADDDRVNVDIVLRVG